MTPVAQGLVRTLLLGLCLCIGMQRTVAGGELLWREEEQRLRVGLKLFPASLGALESLGEGLAPDGVLRVLVVYEGAAQAARQAVDSLSELGKIRGFGLSVKALSASALDAGAERPVSGIFVASVGLSPARLRQWSERYRALVFSPFAGDVEAGAVAGIHVTDRILPSVNLDQARRAHLRFKPFFLQVARQYE